MLPYIIRRLLWAIPTLLAISLATFAFSRFSTLDPIGIEYEQNPAAYRAKAHKLGLDQPAFYVSLTAAAFPDTVHRILPLEARKQFEALTHQTGNWNAVVAYRAAVTSELESVLKHARGGLFASLQVLRQKEQLEEVPALLTAIQRNLDTLQEEPAYKTAVQGHLDHIGRCLNRVLQERQQWKLYVPKLHWHGLNNQYHQWLSGFLTGDPGYSRVTGNPLWAEIRPSLMITLLLNGTAILLAYLIGVPLGVFMSQQYRRPFDRWAKAMLLFLYAIPMMWLGGLLTMLLSRQDIGLGLINGLNAEPWLLSGKTFGRWSLDNLEKFILPVTTLTLHTLALLAMQMRGGMLGVIQQDFVRTARAKGLGESAVYWKHAFRNALFPVITIFADVFPIIFSGSLVVENLFDFPGMGIKMQKALENNDHAVLFAMVLFVSVVTIAANLLADILYAWADPRVRLEQKK